MKWIVIGLIIAAFLMIMLFVRKCPNCGRHFALRETGSRQKSGDPQVEAIETKCRFCGHVKWVETGGGP